MLIAVALAFISAFLMLPYPAAARTGASPTVSVEVQNSLAISLDNECLATAPVIKVEAPDLMAVSCVVLDG